MKRSALISSICAILLCAPPLVAQTQSPAPAPQAPATIPPDSKKYGVYPIGYREIITRWLSDRLVEPATAKIEWSEPRPAEVREKGVRASGYSVEVRINSRNKFGMYTGFQKWRILIRNGEIIWTGRVRQ